MEPWPAEDPVSDVAEPVRQVGLQLQLHLSPELAVSGRCVLLAPWSVTFTPGSVVYTGVSRLQWGQSFTLGSVIYTGIIYTGVVYTGGIYIGVVYIGVIYTGVAFTEGIYTVVV